MEEDSGITGEKQIRSPGTQDVELAVDIVLSIDETVQYKDS